jgi:hypothetical protein
MAISRNGSGRQLAADVRSVHQRLVPYATATALTRTAKRAESANVSEMRSVFDRPTRYTLGSTLVVPASARNLRARVQIKDKASSGRPAERYLLPEVEGGSRNEVATERALRYMGVLNAGERMVPGAYARETMLDASGNIRRAALRAVLTALGHSHGAGKAKRKGSTTVSWGRVAGQRAVYFAGPVGKKGARGVWMREPGVRGVQPVLIFTRTLPRYRPRLAFTRVAEKEARSAYASEFTRALTDLIARKGGAR